MDGLLLSGGPEHLETLRRPLDHQLDRRFEFGRHLAEHSLHLGEALLELGRIGDLVDLR